MQSKVQINVRMWALVSRVETMVVCLMEVTLASVGGGMIFFPLMFVTSKWSLM